jgi:hypothetical protein
MIEAVLLLAYGLMIHGMRVISEQNARSLRELLEAAKP